MTSCPIRHVFFLFPILLPHFLTSSLLSSIIHHFHHLISSLSYYHIIKAKTKTKMHRRGKPYHRVNPTSTPDRNQRSTVAGAGAGTDTRTGSSTGIIDQRLIEGARIPSFKNWMYGSDQEDGYKQLQLQPYSGHERAKRDINQGQDGDVHRESKYWQSLSHSGHDTREGAENELDAFGESQYQIRRQG